uniref:Uncharacterized protein n=1 Tax=Helianthus annuus TaxID=4232 RepID=A0A251T3T9_HELAN
MTLSISFFTILENPLLMPYVTAYRIGWHAFITFCNGNCSCGCCWFTRWPWWFKLCYCPDFSYYSDVRCDWCKIASRTPSGGNCWWVIGDDDISNYILDLTFRYIISILVKDSTGTANLTLY